MTPQNLDNSNMPPASEGTGLLFDDQVLLNSGPVTCLSMTFPNAEERRRHFLGILGEKLKDSEFCKIEGFPIGSDEDILNLSDPPYYVAVYRRPGHPGGDEETL